MISLDIIQGFVNFSSNCMNQLQRHNISDDHIKQLCLDNGLSKLSTDVLIEIFHQHARHWHDTVVFSGVQDILAELKALRTENREILAAVKDMIDIVNKKDSSDRPYFQ